MPGDYAAAEAMKALSLGLHVMLFSDNVDIDEELAVKRHAEGVSEDVKAISPILWVQNRITPNKVGKCKSARQTSAPSSMLCTRLSNNWGAKSIVRLDALRKQRDLTEHSGAIPFPTRRLRNACRRPKRCMAQPLPFTAQLTIGHARAPRCPPTSTLFPPTPPVRPTR